ncbi:hypothetical protein CRYUN_Cryun26dG0053000 [Craigia yunnanensis]
MEPSHSQKETLPLSSKESRINRFKPIWRILLISNLALGGEEHGKSETEADYSSAPVTTPLVYEEPPILPVVAKPVKILEPIPEDQQLELFKWILVEKRKVKPNDPEERKRIDEEKAVLKQFIRAKSLPRI